MQRLTPFRSRFFWKIYLTNAALFFIIVVILGGFGYQQLKHSLKSRIRLSLEQNLILMEPQAKLWLSQPEVIPQSLIDQMGQTVGMRITLLAPDGTVLADSHLDEKLAENHQNRPEVQLALQSKDAFTHRYSDSIKTEWYYLATTIPIPSSKKSGVLRLSTPARMFVQELEEVQSVILILTLLGIGASLIIGFFLARSVTIPIMNIQSVCSTMRRGNYQVRVQHLPDDEIGDLGKTLNALGDEITQKIDTITKDRVQLAKLERIRKDFVANVSHEIKTPLTAIKGYAETLLTTPLDNDPILRRFIEKIDTNAARLTTLVQDILSLARLEDPEGNSDWADIDLNHIVKVVVARFEDLIKQKQLALRVNLNLDQLVCGEQEAITTVVDNLLSNAIRYTPAGGQITLATYCQTGKAVLEVKDTGIGIAKEHQTRVFERFYRVDKARSRDLGGTGLGLAIVKHTVSSLNGDIKLTSQPNKGSVFTVTLPLMNAKAPDGIKS